MTQPEEHQMTRNDTTVPSLPDRIAAKINFDGEGACWLWTAATFRTGYGAIKMTNADGTSHTRYAHRVVYEILVGPIPDGLQAAHRCFVRLCVNPAHIKPVTASESGRWRAESGRARNGNTGVTVCRAGHPFDEANTYTNTATGQRACRKCNAVRYAARIDARRASLRLRAARRAALRARAGVRYGGGVTR